MKKTLLMLAALILSGVAVSHAAQCGIFNDYPISANTEEYNYGCGPAANERNPIPGVDCVSVWFSSYFPDGCQINLVVTDGCNLGGTTGGYGACTTADWNQAIVTVY